MKVVWKYKLQQAKRTAQSIQMPRYADILDVQLQDGKPCFWALVDPEVSMEERRFLLVYTGEERDDLGTYIGTFQVGELVYHLFEEYEELPF